eukprot:TRINITY_DN3720_c0_g2_i1.p1 TRINITY_DN3720_c0_g2~~TRINITY_DN3720_c0_g2_i1.p1  ORF type:complete len:345 (+),score=89.62 TRINITY_DN3720_c0_g2_i1:46-1080(+)
MALLSAAPAADTDALLCQPRRSGAPKPPGLGFKAQSPDGRWVDYCKEADAILKQAYEAGLPSLRFLVRGCMHKFDFESMEQSNLNTLEKRPMKAPHNAKRPYVAQRRSVFSVKNWVHAVNREDSVKASFARHRPAYIVPAPAGKAGCTIKVPHPKKLGKAMFVKVPKDAKAGQPVWVAVPRRGMKSKVGMAIGGTAAGVSSTLGAVAVVEGAEAIGVAAAAAGGAAALTGPALLGGAAVVGAVGIGAAGVHYMTKNPGKSIAVGAVAVGVLALADHIGDVGVVEALDDVAEGVGDGIDAVGDAVDDIGDAADDAVEFGEDVAEFVEDTGEAIDGFLDFVEDLFD